MSDRIAVIGVGRVGSNLAIALQRTGRSVVGVIDENAGAALACAHACGPDCRAVTYETLPPDLALIFIAVGDDRIPMVARRLAMAPAITTNTVVCHLSGSRTAEVLSPLAQRTRLLASCHPVQSFSSVLNNSDAFFNIYFGLEGEIIALQRLYKIIEDLQGRYFVVPSEKKALYHLACVLASNYFVGLSFMVQQILQRADLDALQIMEPLWKTTLKNVLQQGPVRALTGPIVRGDVETVARHLAVMKEFPQLQPIYLAMGRLLLELARQQDNAPSLTELEELFANGF